MDEETKSPDAKVIQLTEQEYQALHRMLQWPEDLAKYDEDRKPTNMAMYLGNQTIL